MDKHFFLSGFQYPHGFVSSDIKQVLKTYACGNKIFKFMDPIVHLLHKVAAGKSNPVVVTNIGSKIFDLFQIFV